MKSVRTLNRHEEKIDERPTIFLLTYNDGPIHFVQGAFSSERKLYAELDRLAKLPENKLTRAQHCANNKAMGINKKMLRKSKRSHVQLYRSLHRNLAVHSDPMDRYSIREITVQ